MTNHHEKEETMCVREISDTNLMAKLEAAAKQITEFGNVTIMRLIEEKQVVWAVGFHIPGLWQCQYDRMSRGKTFAEAAWAALKNGNRNIPHEKYADAGHSVCPHCLEPLTPPGEQDRQRRAA